MKPNELLAASPPGSSSSSGGLGDKAAAAEDAAVAVGALYEAMAVGLIRLAYVILGDRHAAEDGVQEAFCNLFRRWDRLSHVDGAEYYVRVSVLNGCRSVLRHRTIRTRLVLYELPAPSAEAALLVTTPSRTASRSLFMACPWASGREPI